MKLNKYFEYAKQLGFSDVEFKINSKSELSIKVFHKKVEKYTVSENNTITIRGIKNGNMVGGYTENISNINAILDQMAQNANYIENKKEQEIFEGSEKYKKFNSKSNLDKISVQDKINLCLEIEKKAFEYDSRITEVDEVAYGEEPISKTIANSKGLRLNYKVNYGNVVLSLVASDKNDKRTGFHYQFAQDINEFNIDELVKIAADEAIGALGGVPCNSGKYKVLLNQDVFSGLLGSFMYSVSGESVNKGKSYLKDKLGKNVSSKKFTLVEDPHCKQYPFFYRAFDDEGVATYKKSIIEKGVLKTFLYNLEQSKIAHCNSTGNGYGGSQIAVDTAYLYVKPGKKNKEELALKIKNGLYITSVEGLHSGMDPISGNFSLQASGYLIENGKITTPVNLITVAGNLFKVFEDIQEVGNDLKVNYMGYGCPSVIIKKLAISGK